MTAIKLSGVDQKRPPKIRKEGYIDLYFTLSETPATAWKDLFDSLGRRLEPSVKIDRVADNCVCAWVRNMEDISAHFGKIKQLVAECNKQYEEKLRQQALAAGARIPNPQDSQQARLEAVLAELDFDE